MMGIILGAIHGAFGESPSGSGEYQDYVDNAINAGMTEKTYRQMEDAEKERKAKEPEWMNKWL